MKNNSREVVLEFNLPGFTKKDVKLKITKNSLIIKANKKHEKKIQRKDFYHQEKGSQSFNYVTTLPNINPKKAKTSFKAGILKIVIPKK